LERFQPGKGSGNIAEFAAKAVSVQCHG
jgi:hypothetical protein